MKPTFNEKLIAYLTLLSGLSISAVAVYYSVIGLTAIFAAAVIPIVIMGVTLEISKLIATVWLKQNWNIAPKTIRFYLIIAIIVLMFITSMGIFGFLSKAHSDQSLISGDVLAKIAVYDEKIKTARENIDANRRALKQMDEAVDQIMGRSTTETGAEKAVQIRRTQAKERQKLLFDIETEQKNISKLSEEKAPIAAEVRKVEAEVGPIKYIAAFVYGNTDNTILEKAVIWVIIIIICVFDPLAVILLLASQISFQNFRDRKNLTPIKDEPIKESTEGNSPEKESDVIGTATVTTSTEQTVNEFDIAKHPYLFKVPESYYPPGVEPVGPQVYKNEGPKFVPATIIKKNFDGVIKVFSNNTGSLQLQNNDQQEIVVEENNLIIEETTSTATVVLDNHDLPTINKQKINEEINFYVGMIKSRQMDLDSVPEYIKEDVKRKLIRR